MKIEKVAIRNFRSVVDASFELHDYTLLVGANNCGKSTVINALRIFYDDAKYGAEDWPRVGADGEESWVEVTYLLDEGEVRDLPEKYQRPDRRLCVRKILKSAEKDRVKSNQSNLYAVLLDGTLDTNLFFGAKNISQAKLGSAIYIPALSVPNDHLKTSGPSALRNILSFILRRMVSGSAAYQQVQQAFELLNQEARADTGFLTSLMDPMNEAIAEWGITLQLDIKAVSPDEIVKNLVQHSFADQALGNEAMPLDRFGHGFQRSVIYELIRLATRFQDVSEPKKKEFSPEFTLILFEEPEAFLHPDQQVNLSLSLRQLGAMPTQQVLITTHSPIFVGKSSADLKQIVRITKSQGISIIHQVDQAKLDAIFSDGRRLAQTLEAFVNDPTVDEAKKKSARQMLKKMPEADIASEEERFRYQLWLDSDRAGIFFANKVVLCEGPSERALFNYLLENDWFDIRSERISILDALGKYNIHRYLSLFNAFGIKHAVIMDGDKGDAHHDAINHLVEQMCGPHALCRPFKFDVDLETFLGLPKPPGDRNDKKPIEILKALSGGVIAPERLAELKAIFQRACSIETKTPEQTSVAAQ